MWATSLAEPVLDKSVCTVLGLKNSYLKQASQHFDINRYVYSYEGRLFENNALPSSLMPHILSIVFESRI